jgi:predicted dehydrogenase
MNKKHVKRFVSRREFLGAAAAAVTIVPRHVLGGAKFVAPSEKVNIAIIGVGGQGRTNARNLFNEADAQIIAVCDPAEQWDMSAFYFGGLAGRKPVKEEIEKHYAEKTPNYKVAEYTDFRKMLDQAKDIDAVLIATPDHLHAVASIMAMRAGKHVYCEKPLTHNVWEARMVAKVAKETGVATQMGNQGHSGEGLRQTCEWIWDGAIGAIKEVHSWTDAGWFVRTTGRPQGTPPVPSGLDWDLWVGPREARPYHPAYAPYNWRGWWAFGGGALPDMAIHNIDPAIMALKLEHPTTIEATSALIDSEVASTGSLVTWRFAPRGNMPAVKMMWYDGGLMPPLPEGIDPNDPKQRLGEGGNGILFVGEKGFITCAGWAGMPRLLPLSLHREYKRPAKTLPRSAGHHTDWVRACKGGPAACSNFEYGARITELVLLGNVALRSGKVVQWDGPNMKSTNSPEANALLKEQYRQGWEIA